MKDLIERLEKLDGPSRECDAEIAKIIGFFPKTIEDIGCYVDAGQGCTGGVIYTAPKYTSSIDAALTLIPDGLKPEIVMPYDEIRYPESFAYSASLHGRDGSYSSKENGEHKTMAIAICVAALRARQSLLIDGER